MMIQKTNRQKIASLLSMLSIALVVFLVVGIAINWNLLIVIVCFILILGIGLAFILGPGILKNKHKNLAATIDKKMTEYGKKISKATK